MSNYTFVRALVGGRWDIDHPDRGTTLAAEITTQFPSLVFTANADETVFTVSTQSPMTIADQVTLAGLVATHRAGA